MPPPQETDTRPIRLRPDTLTPPTRTPWGGERIRALKGLGPGRPVGESWELSVEPSFPSRTDRGAALFEIFAEDEDGWLGPEAGRGTALLVKLLDAAEPLSVQIHPADGDPRLSSEESGKPEAWYVIDAEPGAGIYLGLEDGVDEAAMRRALEAGDDVSRLLPFVAVAPGDYFVIEAGTPHCIGPGVFLVEPQRVEPGRRGITYRYWDWNRRYDDAGRPSPDGAPRDLHVEDALAVTRWDRPRGAALLDRVLHRAGPASYGDAKREALVAPGAKTPLSTWRLSGTGALALPEAGRLRALTVLAGTVELGDIELVPGRTAAVPASFEGDAHLHAAHAIVAACR